MQSSNADSFPSPTGDWGQQDALPGLQLPTSAVAPTRVPFAVALLALGSVPNVNVRTVRPAVQGFGDRLGALFDLDPSQLKAAAQQLRLTPDAAQYLGEHRERLIEQAAAHCEQLAARRVRVLGPGDLPHRLTELRDGPLWLFVQGDPQALADGPHVAVVGTRNASAEGVRATHAAVRTMAAYPMTLVSGLANGIDAAAHGAALRDGIRNVAFLGHGTDLVFPAETAALRSAIVDSGGCVASEYLPAERYRKAQFVQRNRLQAGLAHLVVAAEGAYSGGTAHTVRFAGTYRRPVVGFRWPGAGDLTRAVAEQPGGELIDIFDAAGRRAFDARCRALADEYGHRTFALELVERQLVREARQRNLTRDDLARLSALINELEHGGNQ